MPQGTTFETQYVHLERRPYPVQETPNWEYSVRQKDVCHSRSARTLKIARAYPALGVMPTTHAEQLKHREVHACKQKEGAEKLTVSVICFTFIPLHYLGVYLTNARLSHPGASPSKCHSSNPRR